MQRGVDGLTAGDLRRGRDEWWSSGFTELLSALLPAGARCVAEIGCGLGKLGVELLGAVDGLRYLGIDRDPARVRIAHAELAPQAGGRAEVLLARGEALPLGDGTVDATLTVTTLMHVPHPLELLREARRITRPGGSVITAEPDNLAQRWYFDGHLEEVTQAFTAVSRSYRDARLPADSCIGPRAASLMRAVGLGDVSVRVHSAWVSRVASASETAERWRTVLATLIAAAGLPADGPLARAGEEALARFVDHVGPDRVGQSVDTVPMFVTVGRVPGR